jgi:hypothetical protein
MISNIIMKNCDVMNPLWLGGREPSVTAFVEFYGGNTSTMDYFKLPTV